MSNTINSKTDTTQLNRLERNIYGTNLINKLTIKNLKKLLPQLEKHLNKKVFLTGGGKANGFKPEFLEYENKLQGSNLRTYFQLHGVILSLHNDVTIKNTSYEGGGHGVVYHKKTVMLGMVDNGVLTSLNDIQTIIDRSCLTDKLNYKTVVKLLAQKEKLQDTVRDIEYKLRELKY